MGVRNSLTLDHFYINLLASDFEKLIKLTEVFNAISHSKVVTTNDHWEGIYLYSRPWSYFEILREWKTPGSFGLCLSPALPHYSDASKIVEEMPDTEWKSSTRKFEDGTLWFDSYYVKDEISPVATEGSGAQSDPDSDSDSARDHAVINTWIMKYHSSHRDFRDGIRRRSVDRYKNINLRVGRNHVAQILKYTAFIPQQAVVTDEKLSFAIPDRDGFTFTIEMELIDGDSRFEFLSLDMDHCHPERFDNFKPLEMGSFLLDASGKSLTLTKRP